MPQLKFDRRQPELRLRLSAAVFSYFHTHKLVTKVDLESPRLDLNLSSEGIVGAHWQKS
jgi:hypothetical protein